MVSKMPMLAVPGWLDREMLPNEPIVVKAEKTIARGVEEAINVSTGSVRVAENRTYLKAFIMDSIALIAEVLS